ncbi:MAG: hypothetical protein K9K63_07345 [Desulfotignum sp.]|nr:hypothetical protein [Desulfotignum sp.]MCF8137108.1 hypothetical protein [Desulfotignum sp.]
MKGKTLGFDSSSQEGAIQGTDGKRYAFQVSEWKNGDTPSAEIPVDFVPNEGYALKIYPIKDTEAEGSILAFGIISLLITFFLGFVGTLISRLALARQPFSKVIVPVLIHAVITLFFFIPVIGWGFYFVCTIYFMVKNYQLIDKGTKNS